MLDRDPGTLRAAPVHRAVRGFTAAGVPFNFDGTRTYVMGVVNLSPESRVAHSVVAGPDDALARARTYREFGANLIDLGGQSSHFENRELTPAEEIDRLAPALELLAADGFVVSVDTWKPAVAEAALHAGAAIVNDTGGLQDAAMRAVVAAAGVPAVAMYIEGDNPLSVGDLSFSAEKADDVAERFRERAAAWAGEGIEDLILDPGLSINYKSDYEEYGRQQLRVIRRLGAMRALGLPVLIPVPRKAVDHRMHAYLTMSLEYGADMIRVHDVETACDLARLFGRLAPQPDRA